MHIITGNYDPFLRCDRLKALRSKRFARRVKNLIFAAKHGNQPPHCALVAQSRLRGVCPLNARMGGAAHVANSPLSLT